MVKIYLHLNQEHSTSSADIHFANLYGRKAGQQIVESDINILKRDVNLLVRDVFNLSYKVDNVLHAVQNSPKANYETILDRMKYWRPQKGLRQPINQVYFFSGYH